MSREGIRGKAETILDPIIKETPIFSNQPKNGKDLYARYTGLTHQTLQNNWNTVNPKTGKKGIMTGCNAFVGWFSRMIGTTYLGGFYPEDELRKIGMIHAWVKGASGGQPHYGDICLHASGLHVSVSLDVKGGTWWRLNAGQGGPGRGADVIDVSSGAWVAGTLKGWVDLEAYFPTPEPVPDWLQGWWEVAFRGDTYYYYFDVTHQVKWSEYPPRDTMIRMTATDGGVGTFSTTDQGHVTIRWRSGNVEKYSRASSSRGEKLSGTWNESASITAERMS